MQRLILTPVRLAVPFGDDDEVQLHMRMRIDVLDGAPRCAVANGDAELFDQLALQRLEMGFPDFDFATGEFPITGHGFAFGTLGEEVFALRIAQYANDDVDDGVVWIHVIGFV